MRMAKARPLVKAFTAVALVAAAECRLSTTPPGIRPLDGTFSLSQINGKPLPAVVATMVNLDPSQPDCSIVVPAGHLIVDAGMGTFVVAVERQNACSGEPMSSDSESGNIAQNGTALVFVERFPDHTDTLTGAVDPQSIRFAGSGYEYVFSRN